MPDAIPTLRALTGDHATIVIEEGPGTRLRATFDSRTFGIAAQRLANPDQMEVVVWTNGEDGKWVGTQHMIVLPTEVWRKLAALDW